jgi:hypothetical protein
LHVGRVDGQRDAEGFDLVDAGVGGVEQAVVLRKPDFTGENTLEIVRPGERGRIELDQFHTAPC